MSSTCQPFLLAVLLTLVLPGLAADPLDVVVFGDAESERSHAFSDELSEVVNGGLDEPARRLRPREPLTWDGGRLAFTVRVDPVQQTYLTIRLWGGEVNRNRLALFIDGRQVGYRHLGDVEILDVGSPEPMAPGRFFYRTSPLPLASTSGRTQVACEIRASGPISGYGREFARYQKPMDGPSRGIYRVYTHVDTCFIPPESERQGAQPAMAPVRTAPGVEVIDQVRARVIGTFTPLLAPDRRLNQMEAHFLARARVLTWIPRHDDPRLVQQVVATVDAYSALLHTDAARIHADPATWNAGWFGVGPLADAVRLLADALGPVLDQPSPTVAGSTRRAAWAALFLQSRDQLRSNRRQYTNQSMIIDLNLYRCNRALRIVAPEQAFAEQQALRYLYEASGIEPWLGSDTPQGPARPLGDGFRQLTAKGLTRELGYVGYYGEVLDWMIQIVEATRDGNAGDARLRAQLATIAQARSWFRHPALDGEGNRAMRIETVIGWRDDHHPGVVAYAMRGTHDDTCLGLAATLRDPASIGWTQQMLADGHLYDSLRRQMESRGLRATMGVMEAPTHHEWLLGQAPSPVRLPLSPGSPDAVFTDEEDGVVALKRGEEILYLSLYWRARPAVNFLARIHHLGPRYDRIATVRQEIRYDPSGHTWKRPDWVNFGFANGGLRYPGDLHSALAGEELPIARVPDGLPFKPGQESLFAGRGTLYRLVYGGYLVGMNMGASAAQHLAFPAGLRRAQDLVRGQLLTADAQGGIALAPRTTVVLVAPP
jgi:hypothetical protein